MWYVLSAIFLGWILGANNTASIFGPGIVAGTFHHRKIVLIGSIFVVLGALLNGQEGLKNVSSLSSEHPYDGMLVLICSALTMLVLTKFGFPASATQTVFGGMVGVGLVRMGVASMRWSTIAKFLIFWLITPLFAVMVAFFVFHIFAFFFRRIRKTQFQDAFIYISSWLTALYDAYALGANNVANVTGPVLNQLVSIHFATLLGGFAIALGVVTSSKKVIDTVGKQIVLLDHFSALIAMLAQAITLWTFSLIGVPIAASQAIVGGIIGVGLARGVKLSSKKTVLEMVGAWFLSPIFSGVLVALACRFVYLDL